MSNLEGFDLNREAHKFDDVDNSPESHHHTLGPSENQAASGADLVRAETRIETLEADEITWTEVTSFFNSWVNYDTDRELQYGKKGNEVWITGVIKDGTSGGSNKIFTLPVGYRPSRVSQAFAAVNNGSVGQIVIEADGDVISNSLCGGSNTFVFISIHFRIDA